MSKRHATAAVYLAQPRHQSMVEIVRPDFVTRDKEGRTIVPRPVDYIRVPRLSLHGTAKISEVVDWSTLANLARYRKHLEGVMTHR